MDVDRGVSRRIAIIRFIMIFGVVILHTPPSSSFGVGGGWFDGVQLYFQGAVFRTTVPVLTFISAYLLFSSNLDFGAARLYRKKCRTLVLPFIAFNGMVLLCVYLAQLHAASAVLYPVYLPGASAEQWANAAFGYIQMPVNYPLNFLRDLIVLIVLAPFFGLLLRNYPMIGLCFVTSFFSGDFDGLFILRNNMAFMFYLGGLFSVFNINVKALDNHAGACLALFLVLCAAVLIFKIKNLSYLGVIAPVLIWPASKLIDASRVGQFFADNSKYTFFIYIAHAPLVAGSAKLYPKVQSFLPSALYWAVTPVVVCAVLIAVYKVAMAVAPVPFSLLVACKPKQRTKGGPTALPEAVPTTA